jgi:hypothetical protein
MEIERGPRFKCDEHHKFYLNPAKSQLDKIEGCLRDIPGNTPELGKCRLPTKGAPVSGEWQPRLQYRRTVRTTR